MTRVDDEAEAASSGDLTTATGTLGKAVALLDLVCQSERPLRFTDLLKITDQPRGSLHRQLRHLVTEGLLDLTPEGDYTAGLRLLGFAAKAWARNSVRQLAEPHMASLHALTGETVHFGVLRQSEIVYLDKLESRQTVRMHSQVGNAAPLYCTGIGKAALSCLDDTALGALVARMSFHSFTPATLSTPQALLADVAQIRERGFAYDLEEHQPGICCVAAAIATADRSFVGGISVTAPAFRVSRAQLTEWAEPVRRSAAAMAVDFDSGLGPRRKSDS
jgi:IclR family transcriptional regulator, acetate operon repressor